MDRCAYSGLNYRKAVNVEELRAIAKRRLPNFVYEYIHGGSDDEVTLERNRAIFDKYYFTPRTLTKVSKQRSLETSIFGKKISMPVLIGPTGFNGMVTKDGDTKLARAATHYGIPFTLSNASTTSLEDISKIDGLWHWMQIYFYRNRDYVKKLVERCKEANYDTIVVTTDSAIFGNREWDRRNYSRPLVLTMRNKLHVLTKPRWLNDVLIPDGIPQFKNLGDLLPPGETSVKGAAAVLGQQLDPSLNWDDIRWLRDEWKGRLVIKGILSVEEAATAVEVGVDGIVLSNHGGRQLDYSVSPMELIADIRAEVGNQLAILVDSGFRRGSDVLKARLLGADAVLLGRTTLYGLGAGGQEGAEHALNIIREEMDRILGLLGCNDLSELDSASLMVSSSR
ncbi:alpha-hydroxy acid oxidase [Vreelandella indica]|uniref:alpha-hydroxy acid oxidase n=1 Tax=Vreelandella indica TaxID=3126500 RepID=UPI0025BE8179|nr:alpha-hydroxy acid oxidase [Halomonas sp. UBA3074]|tara:strand:+ start:11536 stop:12720 length:1185 start_codon:yes stop_codon:yes gene_type:complete